MVQEKLWFMHIKDKINVSNKRKCPAHYWPHKLPFGEKVTCENCHIHINPLRKFHHYAYCWLLNCPNYTYMEKKDTKKIELKYFFV